MMLRPVTDMLWLRLSSAFLSRPFVACLPFFLLVMGALQTRFST